MQWLWSTLIRQELNTLKDHFNNHVVHKDKEKKLPSSVSPNVAYTLYEQYRGEQCLQPVDHNFVKALIEAIGGEICLRPLSQWPVHFSAWSTVLFSITTENCK